MAVLQQDQNCFHYFEIYMTLISIIAPNYLITIIIIIYQLFRGRGYGLPPLVVGHRPIQWRSQEVEVEGAKLQSPIPSPLNS